MKKRTLVIAAFALNFMLFSCASEEVKTENKVEEEMSVDEKELEEEFEKLDEDVEDLETLSHVIK